MRGEPVLPSKFASLLDTSSSNDSNKQELRKRFILYHELDHHCEKFDENILDFNRRLIQTLTDVQELLNGSYSRFPNLENIPQLIDIENSEQLQSVPERTNNQQDTANILGQTTFEDEHSQEPLAPEIVQKQTNNDN